LPEIDVLVGMKDVILATLVPEVLKCKMNRDDTPKKGETATPNRYREQ